MPPFSPIQDRPGAGHLAILLQAVWVRDLPRAVVPEELHPPALALGGELVGDLRRRGPDQGVLLRVVALHLGPHGRRRVEVQRPEGRVDDVADPVADPPGAEGQPRAPPGGHVHGVVGPAAGRAEPEVPVQLLGHGVLLLEARQLVDGAVGAPEGVAGGVHLGDLPDRPVPDPLAQRADPPRRVPLVAELRDHLGLAGGLADLANLVDRVGQGLLAVDVFAAFQCGHAGHRVRVVRRADHHGVDVLVHRVEHLAEIFESLGLGELLERAGRPALVHVAQRDDVLAADAIDVVAALPGPPRT